MQRAVIISNYRAVSFFFFSFVLLEFWSDQEGPNTKSSTSVQRRKMNLAHRNYVSTCEEFFDNTRKGGG